MRQPFRATINVPEKVAPETRRRVEEAVRELGFVPNRAARGLITGTDGQRRGDRPRHHQPALRVPGAIGGAVGPAERSAGAPGGHRRAPGRRGASRGVPVPGGRRLHRRFAAPPASRAGALGSDAGGLRQPARARARVHSVADGTGRGRRPAAFGRPRAHPLGLPGWAERIVGGRGAAHCGTKHQPHRRDAGGRAHRGGADVRGHGARRAGIVASGVSAVLAFNDQMALGVVAGLPTLASRFPTT